MPFNSETGKLGGLKGGSAGGSRTSAAKTIANRIKGQAAADAGLVKGRPIKADVECTCHKETHSSSCRVYMTIKKRESRERLALTKPKPIKRAADDGQLV